MEPLWKAFHNRPPATGTPAWDDDRMDAGELVRGEVVIGYAAMRDEIFAIGPGIDRADRDDEPQPIRGRDFTSAPSPGQGNGRLGIGCLGTCDARPQHELRFSTLRIETAENVNRTRVYERSAHSREADSIGH